MPISAHRSLVPMSSTSTPGTAAISSAFSIARGDSSITTTRPCSFTRRVAAADAVSTVRAWRRPGPSARRPSFSRCLARLGCMARSLWNYADLRYNGFRYITGCVIRMKRNHSHPGIVLLEQFLKPSGLSQNALARDIGVPPRRINEIILGKRGITADTALRLANHFGNSARYWMSLQTDFDLEEARRERIPTTISRG